MATILLTGAAGFIGSWIAEALIERGDKVIAVDNFNAYYDVDLKRARVAKFKDKITLYEEDISDYKAMEEIFKKHKIDKVCHIAAQAGVRYSLTDPFSYERSNTLGTLNLLELCRHNGIKTFLYASSSSVYGNNEKIPFSEQDRVDKPISLYAATKRSNELMAYTYHHLFGLQCTGLRFFTVYGPWGRPDLALFKFVKAMLEDKPIDVYNYGKMKRDFTYVTDVVSAVLVALDKSYPFEIFNIGNSKPVELLYFIECIEKALGKKSKMNMLPLQPGDVPITYADIKKAKKMLGYNPKFSIEEGIKNFVEWYKQYYKI